MNEEELLYRIEIKKQKREKGLYRVEIKDPGKTGYDRLDESFVELICFAIAQLSKKLRELNIKEHGRSLRGSSG